MSKHSELAETLEDMLNGWLMDMYIKKESVPDLDERLKLIDEKLSGVDPVAFACRTCDKIDWADDEEQKAQPEHISYRGFDIGSCEGKMIKLYESLKVEDD